MKQQTQQEKLKSIGISMLALGFFPLIWFLFQAILFRELTEIISRNLLVVFALIIGSTFVFLLFFMIVDISHSLRSKSITRCSDLLLVP